MDFCQSEPDFTKVPLYQPDHITFLNKEDSLLKGTEHQQQQQQQSVNPNPTSWTPPSFDLQDMLVHYRSQPDLLQLILESKLQEDRRRTEEARLKAKELDLMLLQHQHQFNQQQASFTTASLLSSSSASSASSSSSPQTQSSSSSSSDHHQQLPSSFMKRRDSSLFSSTGTSEDLDEVIFLQQMATSLPDSIDTHESMSPPCPIPEFYNNNNDKDTIQQQQQQQQQKPRKRREMQAITKLVETREYPYLDGHFWRNNGNTIQKKTGNKSVYFKCSNSTKGCPVNKTSTYCQETGEYIIKYRGEHLPECGKVQHIVEV
ncbi:uncharacterized protein BX664DRAFT_332613 [Halteromyces radiatus]|uniref:uncharacterized protein n=1 Tax=Halteromyces radiatus TaxID=101107 RepID=UPI00221EEFAD|nr:uncharacterized protein BX664DRAFT_332613 [Halteromyces radiatus]KAI8089278.1 hypothetical protein BX664DRAFT_332613 [Halteromyces radiatus]